MPIKVNGRIAAVVGVDLYGAHEKVQSGIKGLAIKPKITFSDENRLVAEDLASKAGTCVELLLGSGKASITDWSIAYLDVVLKLSRQNLVDYREVGVSEIREAHLVPGKQVLVIIDALLKILDYRNPDYTALSWTGKRDIFLDTNMWNRMIRFHPDRWRGDYKQLIQTAQGLYNIGPDQVAETCSSAFQMVFSWLDIVLVMMSQQNVLSEAFRRQKEAEVEEADPLAAIDQWKLPDEESEDEDLVNEILHGKVESSSEDEYTEEDYDEFDEFDEFDEDEDDQDDQDEEDES